MEFVNLTNNDISVLDKNGNVVIFKKSGKTAMITSIKYKDFILDNFYIKGSSTGDVIGLPKPKEDTIYIVSGMVLTELNGSRKDVVAPNRNNAKRDEFGQIIYVKGFIGIN